MQEVRGLKRSYEELQSNYEEVQDDVRSCMTWCLCMMYLCKLVLHHDMYAAFNNTATSY